MSQKKQNDEVELPQEFIGLQNKIDNFKKVVKSDDLLYNFDKDEIIQDKEMRKRVDNLEFEKRYFSNKKPIPIFGTREHAYRVKNYWFPLIRKYSDYIASKKVYRRSDEIIKEKPITHRAITGFESLPYDVFENLIVTGKLKGNDLIRLCDASYNIRKICTSKDGLIFRRAAKRDYGIDYDGPNPKKFYNYRKSGKAVIHIVDLKLMEPYDIIDYDDVLDWTLYDDIPIRDIIMEQYGFMPPYSELIKNINSNHEIMSIAEFRNLEIDVSNLFKYYPDLQDNIVKGDILYNIGEPSRIKMFVNKTTIALIPYQYISCRQLPVITEFPIYYWSYPGDMPILNHLHKPISNLVERITGPILYVQKEFYLDLKTLGIYDVVPKRYNTFAYQDDVYVYHLRWGSKHILIVMDPDTQSRLDETSIILMRYSDYRGVSDENLALFGLTREMEDIYLFETN